jgi:hypothetical protein
MATYKTTSDDFRIFQEAVVYWQKRLGMLTWQIYTRHQNKEGAQAYCAFNLGGRSATIYLSKVLHNYDEPPGDRLIKRMAFHEVCELLMARMAICATARFVTAEEIEEARHEVIRTMEHVIFDGQAERPVEWEGGHCPRHFIAGTSVAK